MRITRTCLAVLFLLSGAAAASAQGLTIEFNDGLVTLSAQNVPLRTILAEWTRQGGTRIINAERVTGTPVTVEFTNTSERKVLETILRSMSGYVLAPRREGSTTRSSFDSILLVPTSTAAPRPAGAPASAQPAPFRPQLQIPPVAFDPNDPEENPPGDIAPNDPDEDLPVRGPRRVQRVNPNVPGVRVPEQEDPDAAPVDAAPAPRPNNPFGVQTGSSRPGTITPVPQRQGQNGNGQPDQD